MRCIWQLRFYTSFSEWEWFLFQIQYKGKPLHVQCSKILGHLLNMSFHWKNRYVYIYIRLWLVCGRVMREIICGFTNVRINTHTFQLPKYYYACWIDKIFENIYQYWIFHSVYDFKLILYHLQLCCVSETLVRCFSRQQ